MNISNLKFSIIFPIVDSSINIDNTLNSLINQSIDFKENIEVIFIVSTDCDELLLKCNYFKDKYPDNILIKRSKNIKKSYCRNLALDKINGEYVGFIQNNECYDTNVFESVCDFFENNKDIDIVNINSDNSEKKCTYEIIDLNINPNNPLFDIGTIFIKNSLAKSIKFNEKLHYSSESLYINKLLLKTRKYGLISDINYKSSEKLYYADDIYYFTPRLINFHMDLIKYCISNYNQIPLFIQYTLIKDIEEMLLIENLNVYSDSEDVKYFWNTLKKIFSYITEDVIINNSKINFRIRSFLIYLKNDSYKIIVDENEVKLLSNEYLIDSLTKHKLWLDNITIRKDKLIITGLLLTNFYNESLNIYVLVNNSEKINTRFMYYPQDERKTLKFLSQEWRFSYNFETIIKITEENITDISFVVEYHENEDIFKFTPKLEYRETTGINNFNTYLIKKEYLIFHSLRHILITKNSYYKMLKFEVKNILNIIKSKEDKKYQNVYYRILYLLLYPILSNKTIYLYNDRLDNSYDNGRYLFEHAISQDDQINNYYVINKDLKDKTDLKHNVIVYGTMKHKILYLFSDKLITSFLGEKFYNPFLKDNKKLYSNKIQIPKYFIQHGIIYKNLTSNIKRFNHELELLLTTTTSEYESFFDLEYNYSKEVVQLLGLPRFDKLNNDNLKNQILFCPTWRSNLQNKSNFKKTTYYNMITNFLNNPQLHKILKKYQYKLIFKPHPELVKDLNKFKIDKNIKISTNENYSTLFNTSKLLITDYSSVFFDFAYLKKPIIYYQKKEDFHYAEGYFNYENDGFGDVIHTLKELNNKIEDYLENNCQIEEKYLERINKTFKYHDKNNCERVYNWIKEN